MKGQKGFWHLRLGLLLVVLLLVLGPGRAIGERQRQGYSGLEREALIKNLGLTAEQVTVFQAIGDKFTGSREGIIAGIKNNESDLEKALSTPQTDETRITGLVTAITQGHDHLMQTFKDQRQEEMVLLTPVQQGRFLLALKKWHEEMKQGREK